MLDFVCPTCGGKTSGPSGAALPCLSCGQRVKVPASTITTLPSTRVEAAFSAPAPRRRAVRLTWPGLSWLRSVLRWGAPTVQLLAMLLLFAPFVEIRITVPPPLDATVPTAWQSGFQALYGGYSFSADVAGFEINVIPLLGSGLHIFPDIVFVCLFAATACVSVIGLTAPLGRSRAIKLGAVMGAALVLLLLHFLIGFPLQQALYFAKTEVLSETSGIYQLTLQAALSLIRASYTIWFWLWVMLFFVSLALVAVEMALTFAQRSLITSAARSRQCIIQRE